MKFFLLLFFVASISAQASMVLDENTWSIATESGSVDFILEHLQAGHSVNGAVSNNGNTALINAVESRNLDAVRLLVSEGADINAVVCTADRKKKCALTSAFRLPEIFEFLLDAGADVHIRLNRRRTPLHCAAEKGESYLEDIQALLRYGADPNIRDLYGNTPLHAGIRRNKIAFILLDHGADLNIAEDSGLKPLHTAYGGDLELLKDLVRRGASLHDFTPMGKNALHCTRAYDSEGFERIKFLIEECHMDINQPSIWTNRGTGAPNFFMHVVMQQLQMEDDFEILDYLIEKGADINATTFHIVNGRTKVVLYTALSWARTHSPRYIIEWLIQHGAK